MHPRSPAMIAITLSTLCAVSAVAQVDVDMRPPPAGHMDAGRAKIAEILAAGNLELPARYPAEEKRREDERQPFTFRTLMVLPVGGVATPTVTYAAFDGARCRLLLCDMATGMPLVFATESAAYLRDVEQPDSMQKVTTKPGFILGRETRKDRGDVSMAFVFGAMEDTVPLNLDFGAVMSIKEKKAREIAWHEELRKLEIADERATTAFVFAEAATKGFPVEAMSVHVASGVVVAVIVDEKPAVNLFAINEPDMEKAGIVLRPLKVDDNDPFKLVAAQKAGNEPGKAAKALAELLPVEKKATENVRAWGKKLQAAADSYNREKMRPAD